MDGSKESLQIEESQWLVEVCQKMLGNYLVDSYLYAILRYLG